VGEPDVGTRVFRREGLESECGEWFQALDRFTGPLVSPGGVSMFAPVSRAAVHKRLKEGRMTAFCFHAIATKTGFFGRKKTVRESPLVYIPVSECKAWAEELKERMLRLGQVTREELEGEKPDWSNAFWKWDEKKRKRNNERR
jgi:hypothetical protein